MSLQPTDPPLLELAGEIGRGATGRVWRARLLAPIGGLEAGAEVALKRLHPELHGNEPARAAFETECRATASVRHPGLVRLVQSGVDATGPYLITEYVPGSTLERVLAEQGPLSEPLLRSVAMQLAGGLAALHEQGWLHGDVKLENMRIDSRGRAVLLDLGFARRIRRDPAEAEHPSRSGDAVGSGEEGPDLGPGTGTEPGAGPGSSIELAQAGEFNPGSLAYLAPERARGERGDERSDVFSLGVALYELATGAHPFAADFAVETPFGERPTSSVHPMVRSLGADDADRLIAALASARYRPASALVPQLSPFLDHLLAEALRRDPRRRTPARELARRLLEQESGSWWRAQIDERNLQGAPAMAERSGGHLTPLVGRDRELAEIERAYRRAVGLAPDSADLPPGAGTEALPDSPALGTAAPEPARGGALWLVGPVGSGKSRLMRAFAEHARRSAEPPLYLYGRSAPQEEDRPCGPVLRLMLRWLRLPPQTTHLGPREQAALERVAPPKEALTLARALDQRASGESEAALVPALARWLILLSRRSPVVVFLDDVNFADDGTLGVLLRVAEELSGKPLFLVLGSRLHDGESNARLLGQLERALESRALASRVELGPLDEEAVLELVTRLFHHSAPRLRIAQVLYQRSRGNPGMIGEIVRGLLQRGEAHAYRPAGAAGSGPGSSRPADFGLGMEDAGLVLSISPERLPLPESLSTLIHGRYRKLPPLERRWLRRLSIVGGRISTSFLLAAFQPVGEAELLLVLERMVRDGWLVPAGDRFRFARPALREAVYRAIPEDSRARLHAQAARALAPQRGQSLSIADAYQRAFHLRAAGDAPALLRVLRPLLKAMVKRGQTQRVHAIARWGVEALDTLGRTKAREIMRIEFLEAAADAADRLGYRGEQRAWLDQLSDLELSPETDAASLARVYLLHGRHAVSTGQYGLARGFLKNAVDLGLRAGAMDVLVSEAERRLSAVQAHVGELEGARELAKRALERAVHDPQRAVTHLQLGVIDLLEDELESALRQVDRALSLLRNSRGWNLPGVLAAAHMLRGRVYRLLGRPARALGAMQHAVRLARQAAERRLEMEATARLGGLLLDIDRAEDAEAKLRDALLIANETEDRRGQTLAGLWLGILLWEHDDPEAPRLLARVGPLANEMGLSRAEALCLAIQARISRARGDFEAALQDSLRASELLERHGAEMADRIVITGTRALILHTVGEHDAGARLVKDLRRRLRRESERVQNPELRASHIDVSRRLLDAVLSPEGPIYPRLMLPA